MSIKLEKIKADQGSDFRVLHLNTMPAAYQWNYHYHPEIEIVLVLDGFGRRHVGNHVSYYHDGDLVMIGPNLPHSGFGFGAMNWHQEIVIQFNLEIFGDRFLENSATKSIFNLIQKSKDGLAFNKKYIPKAKEYCLKIKSKSGLDQLIALIEFLDFLAKQSEIEVLNAEDYMKNINLKDTFRLSRIFEFVDKNFADNINSNDLAKISNLTLPAFCSYFKQNFNVTFTDFLNEYRINKACKILLDGHNITEACFLVGFNSLPYFSRTFKKIRNMSPSQYQNQYFRNKQAKK